MRSFSNMQRNTSPRAEHLRQESLRGALEMSRPENVLRAAVLDRDRLGEQRLKGTGKRPNSDVRRAYDRHVDAYSSLNLAYREVPGDNSRYIARAHARVLSTQTVWKAALSVHAAQEEQVVLALNAIEDEDTREAVELSVREDIRARETGEQQRRRMHLASVLARAATYRKAWEAAETGAVFSVDYTACRTALDVQHDLAEGDAAAVRAADTAARGAVDTLAQ